MDKRTISKYGWIIIAIIAIVAVIAIAIPVAELVKGGTSNSVDKYYESETNTPGNGDININRPSSEKYIITYIPNCDDIVIPNDEYSEENPVVLPKPTRDHYWFEGWYENSDLSGDPVTTTRGSSGDKTYYGKWKPKKYTITYNTGTDDIVIPNGSYDVENPVILPVPEREGYDFEGWYEDPSFPGEPIESTEGSEGDKEYYAKWKAHTYTVVYNSNGGSGTMANSTFTYDTAAALRNNTFTKTGYTFAGWATSATGGVIYTNGQFVKNLTSINGGTVTLYAKWKVNTYTVKYDGNGNTGGSTASSSHTYDEAKALTTNGYTKTGYTFAGWNTKADGTGTSYADKTSIKNLTATNGATVTLYAVWVTNPIIVTSEGYTGTYDGNAHSMKVIVNSPSGTTVTYSTSLNGTYSTTNPTYTNAGTYTVYYKVAKAGYTTVTGSEVVQINKAPGWVTLSGSSGTITYPNDGSFTVKSYHGGALSVTTSNNSVATATISGTKVTVKSGTTADTATITVTSAATTNYTAASATYKVTVKSGTLSVTANGYTGTYDGKAHSISVNCSGATITYATSKNGIYNSVNPTYTNAGTYTVYYKVTKAGYETITGSEVVQINKAAGKVTLSSSTGSLTYPATDTFTVTENISGGELSLTISNNKIVTATINGTIVITKSNTTAGTTTITVTSAETDNYYSASATYTIAVKSGTLNVTANGYTGVYDGKSHGITVTAPDGATITYTAVENGTYSSTNPTYTNAGTYTVYYKVVKSGYETVLGSKTVKISKAPGKVTLSSSNGSFTYPASGTINVTENISGGDLSVKSSNSSIATATINGTVVTIKSGSTAGTATITVTSAETTNYYSASATYSVAVRSGGLNVSATGYTGTYDGNAHSITVTAPTGATITYSTTENGTYNETNPSYTNAGTYTVYYKVAKAGYTTVTGSEVVQINKAPGWVTLSGSSGTITYPNDGSFTVESYHGGALSVTTSSNSVATATISGTKVTVKSGTTANTATITVTSAETTNYTAASATYKVTVKSGTLNVTANGYTGTYDGKAHGITVTAPSGTAITYSTAENGTYSSTNPAYTNAGTYTVYYKVTKAGYTTVTGSKVVQINKAPGWITLSSATGTITYPNSGSFTVTDSHGGTLSAKTSNGNIASDSISGTTVTVKSGTTAGKATITVTSAETTNYTAASATYEVTVKSGTLNVTASGYDNDYDGKAHGITVTAPSGASITYSTAENGTYSSTNPTYTDSGNYTVYYKVSKAGYTSVSGSAVVKIAKIPGKVTLSSYSGEVKYPTPTTFTITENISGGEITIGGYDGNKAEVSRSGMTVTIEAGKVLGTTTIVVISAETQNYYSASAEYKVTNTGIKPTAYAVYSADDNSLRFYLTPDTIIEGGVYNSKTSTAVYTGFETANYTDASEVPWYEYREIIQSVEDADTTYGKIAPKSMAYWFYGFKNCVSFRLEDFNTSNVTSMKYTFAYALETSTWWPYFYVSTWDTSSVTDMTGMFYHAFSGFSAMGGSTQLEANIGNWDTSNVTNMTNMFRYACSTGGWISSFEISNWDVSSVTSMDYMFEGTYTNNSNAFTLDLSSWNVQSLTSTRHMFYEAGKKAGSLELNVSTWEMPNVTSLDAMFGNAGYSVSGNISINASNWNTSGATSMSEMFYYMGYDATGDISINVSNMNTSNVTNMSKVFGYAGCNSTGSFSISGLNTWNTSNVKNFSAFLRNSGVASKSWSVGSLANWDTSKVTNMSWMFYYSGFSTTTTWTVGDISNWDVSQVTTTERMFSEAGHDARTWTVGLLADWDVSSVTDMSYMFHAAGYNARRFEIDVTKWNVSNVENFESTFRATGYGKNADTIEYFSIGDLSTKEIVLENGDSYIAWDVSMATNMTRMFRYVGYTYVDSSTTKWGVGDISNWDVSSVELMDEMFMEARDYQNYTLNLSNWDVSSVTSHVNFEYEVESKIIEPNW